MSKPKDKNKFETNPNREAVSDFVSEGNPNTDKAIHEARKEAEQKAKNRVPPEKSR